MHPINIKDLYKTEIFRKTIEVEYGFNRIDNSQEPDKGMIDILNLHGFNELPKVVPDNETV